MSLISRGLEEGSPSNGKRERRGGYLWNGKKGNRRKTAFDNHHICVFEEKAFKGKKANEEKGGTTGKYV